MLLSRASHGAWHLIVCVDTGSTSRLPAGARRICFVAPPAHQSAH